MSGDLSNHRRSIIGHGTLLPLRLPTPGLFPSDQISVVAASAGMEPHQSKHHRRIVSEVPLRDPPTPERRIRKAATTIPGQPPNLPGRVMLIRSAGNDEEVVPFGSEPLTYYHPQFNERLPFNPNIGGRKQEGGMCGRFKMLVRNVIGLGLRRDKEKDVLAISRPYFDRRF